MRVALIATDEAGYGQDCQPAELGGRALILHQLDFALGQGCGKILFLGHPSGPEALALREAAERAGAQFQVLRGPRDLPATVRGDDELLVLARGLLPDSPKASELLRQGPVILSLPVQAGAAGGFELLDLTAAWGGALLMPGRLMERLDALPDDGEPIAGLLRIARQASVPERQLPEADLVEGRWALLRSADQSRAVEPAWLRRRLPPGSPWHPTAWLARTVLRRFGAKATASTRAMPLARVATGAALAGALVSAWYGHAVAGFVLLAVAAMAIELGDAIGQLTRPSFAGDPPPSRLSRGLRLALDAALAAVGALALPGALHRRVFLAILPVALLHVSLPEGSRPWRALVEDRVLLIAALALAVGFGVAEKGFMAATLVLIALRIGPLFGKRG